MIKVIEKSKIKTKEFVFNMRDEVSADLFVQSLNYVPFLYFSKLYDTRTPPVDGTTINSKDIVYVKLHNSKFLPEIEILCYDSSGIFITDLYPFDHDSLISIFVKSNSEITMPIRMDFRVIEFETIKSLDSQVLKYSIKGILDVDELQYTKYESRKGTSYEVLKEMAKEFNLGFASNVEGSNDEMTWINPGEIYLRFMKEITEKAFITERSFVWSFIDFYYNLNYVDIETELNSFNRSEEQTITNPTLNKNDEESTGILYLTNSEAFNMTNKYISKYNLINQSYKVNLEKSYRMMVNWYDKNENKNYRQFLIDLETESEDIIPLYDYTSGIFARNIEDETIYTENNDEYFLGKINTDNVHKNYAIADVSNAFNLKNIEKLKMVVTLNQINFDIKRFQTVRVEIYNIKSPLSRDAAEKTPFDNINGQLSGFWLVTGINYLYKRVGGVEQEITLMRRDLNINYGEGTNEQSDLRKTKQ